MAADATKYEEESDVSVEEDDRARDSCDDESRGECLQTSTPEVDREETSCQQNLPDSPPSRVESREDESADGGATLCPQCHDQFKNPRILPCAHVMCRDCLVSLLQQLRTACCPRCNCCILDPSQDDNQRAEDIADDLSEDKATTVLVDCATFLQQSHPCCVCDKQTALWVCLDCGDPMCSTCVPAHRKFSFTSSHDVEELSALSPSTMALRRHPSSYKRPGGTLEMYCRDHKMALTSHAAAREHRKCAEVSTLENECREINQTLSDLTDSLCTSKQAVQEALLRLELYDNDETRKILDSLCEGESACDQVEKAVADCRRQFKERASRAKEELKKVVSERRMLLLEKQGRLASHVQLTQRVKGMGVGEEKVQMLQTLETQVDCSLRTCGVPQDLEGSSSPLISINPQLLHFIKTAIGSLNYVVPPRLSETWEEVVNFIKNTPGKFDKDKKLLASELETPPLSMSICESPLSEVLPELDHPLSEVLPELDHPLSEVLPELDHPLSEVLPELDHPLSEVLPELDHPLSEVLSERDHPFPEVVSQPKSKPASPAQMTGCSSRRSSLAADRPPEYRPRRVEWSPDDEDVRRLYQSDSYVYMYPNRSLATHDSLPRVSRDQKLSDVVNLFQPCFRFHKNAGTNIMICDNNTTAKTKIPGIVGNGLLFTWNPMRLGVLYEVQVKHVVSDVGSEMSVGVCFRDPDDIRLPAYASNINRNTGVIISPRQYDGGGETNYNDPRRQLRDIPDGRRVGVLVDSQLWLHLYINGIDCGPLIQLNQTFFYAMFELYCGVEEVCSLPVQEEP